MTGVFALLPVLFAVTLTATITGPRWLANVFFGSMVLWGAFNLWFMRVGWPYALLSGYLLVLMETFTVFDWFGHSWSMPLLIALLLLALGIYLLWFWRHPQPRNGPSASA
jgi:uncharacterized membrane protein HdeD (DUF308 family)